MVRQYAQALIYCRHDHLLAPNDKLLRIRGVRLHQFRTNEGSDRQTNQMLNLIFPKLLLRCIFSTNSISFTIYFKCESTVKRNEKKTREWFYLWDDGSCCGVNYREMRLAWITVTRWRQVKPPEVVQGPWKSTLQSGWICEKNRKEKGFISLGIKTKIELRK